MQEKKVFDFFYQSDRLKRAMKQLADFDFLGLLQMNTEKPVVKNYQ